MLLSIGCTFFLIINSARADSIFVADYFAGTIERLGLDGTGVTFGTANSPGTFGLACDSLGNLYVGTIGGPIEKFDSNGNKSVFTSALNDAGDLAVDSSGNLYAINDGNVNVGIQVFSPSGTPLRSIVVGDSNHNPRGLAVDAAGNIFVGINQSGTNSIEKITPSGTVSVFASLVTPAQGLAFDSSGNLYATTGSSIYKYTQAGVRSIFVSNGLNSPQGLAFDGTGNLYVVVGGNQIEKFTSANVGSAFASVSNAVDIAVALSLPPATDTPTLPQWALICLAAALLIVAGRSASTARSL